MNDNLIFSHDIATAGLQTTLARHFHQISTIAKRAVIFLIDVFAVLARKEEEPRRKHECGLECPEAPVFKCFCLACGSCSLVKVVRLLLERGT